jgi:hypothetical protein
VRVKRHAWTIYTKASREQALTCNLAERSERSFVSPR